MRRFQLMLLPKNTEITVVRKGEATHITLRNKDTSPSFESLRNILLSVSGIKEDEQASMEIFDKECYYHLNTDYGIVHFEINLGKKEEIKPLQNCISIITMPSFPKSELLEKIKSIIKNLREKYEFKIFLVGLTRFITIDELNMELWIKVKDDPNN